MNWIKLKVENVVRNCSDFGEKGKWVWGVGKPVDPRTTELSLTFQSRPGMLNFHFKKESNRN